MRFAAYALMAGLVLHVLHGPGGVGFSAPDAVFETWIYNGVLIGSALVCAARAVLVREERVAWALISVGLLAWCAADVYYLSLIHI